MGCGVGGGGCVSDACLSREEVIFVSIGGKKRETDVHIVSFSPC